MANDVQTAVRMPEDLRQRLVAAAGDRSLGDEIRRRLEASFTADPPKAADEKTADLLRHIATMADAVRAFFGDWHSDPGGFAILRRAVDMAMGERQPDGDPVLRRAPSAPKFMEDVADVETAATMVAAVASWWAP